MIRILATRKQLLRGAAITIAMGILAGTGGISSSLATNNTLTSAAPLSQQRRDKALEGLYDQLAKSQDAREAKRIEAAITRHWLRSGSDTADLLLVRAHVALGVDDAALAIELLDRTIVLMPDWAETYALRGQIFAALGDDERAVADLNHVLLKDPRHFMALKLLAEIFERRNMRKGALTLYERALAIHPHLDNTHIALEKLRTLIDGRAL